MVFNQSKNVPKTDREVAKILKKIREEGFGLKNAVYGGDSNNFNRNTRRNMSLAVKILEKFSLIEHVLNTTQILSKETHLDAWLARVFIHKLLRNKELTHECKPVQIVNSYKKEIQDAIATYQESDSQPKIKVFKPRYVRINTYKMSVDDVIGHLNDDGFEFMSTKYETYSKYLEALNNLESNCFMIDFHIKEMLVFNHGTQFIKHPLYINGTLLLQDKASCLSPLLLNPPKGSVVLDMCAAPGMKTNYLANQVGEKGLIYAVEKNLNRYGTLVKLTSNQGINNVSCIHKDALKVTGNELADVEYILVDPSCSGTGMVERIDVDESAAPDRLQFLSGFQKKILLHALTRFPNVKRVVYSTCSIHPEENEEVVSFVLGAVKNYQLVNLQEKLGSKWNNFGSDKYGEIGTSCLYAKTEQDLTNGFFVAVFERIANQKVQKRKYEETEETEINTEEHTTKDKKKKYKSDYSVEEIININESNNEIPEKKKKRKKDKAEKNTENEEIKMENEQNTEHTTKDKKKKRKKKSYDAVEEIIKIDESNNETLEKKKKRKKDKAEKNTENDEEMKKENEQNTGEHTTKDKKKNRKKKSDDAVEEIIQINESNNETPEKKKKRKKNKAEKSTDNDEKIEKKNEQNTEEHTSKDKKKKRKKKSDDEVEEIIKIDVLNNETPEKKKKRKKDKAGKNTENDEEIKKKNGLI